jgi:hypothetical protein
VNIPCVNGHHFRAGAAPSCRARRHHADEPLGASCASKVRASSAISVRGNTLRNVFGPDEKVKLVLVYPMTTGRILLLGGIRAAAAGG